MPPFNATFDANQFEPKQFGSAHPVGAKFDFEITGTEVKPTKDGDGGMFVVTFTTPAGSIDFRYNLFNKSAKAVEIAHGQFSALCRAVGRYQIDFNNEGAILRGARGKLDVGYQKGEEPSEAKPDGGYVEVKKVYDASGNEPGKAPAQPQTQAQPQGQQAAQNQPMTQQPGGGWGNAAPQGQANPAPSQGFGGANPNPAPANSNGAGGAWQPGNAAAGGAPPWGAR